uniref:Dirigent protein n=1 Tax=Ananas comosus var. bracteatus TaxID=296719 RepID=A0A6V7Q9H5_ANACO|nr:unnamed protein product [Ananas comosus var. bracteatus]
METLKPTPLLSLLLLLTLAAAVAATANASARKTGPPVPVTVDAAAAPSTSPSDVAEDAATSASPAVAAAAPSTSSSDVADDAAASASASASASEQPRLASSCTTCWGARTHRRASSPGSSTTRRSTASSPSPAPTAPCSRSTAGSRSAAPPGTAPSTTTTSPSSPASAGPPTPSPKLTVTVTATASPTGSRSSRGEPPEGTSLQKLLFGTLTVMDDELTEGPELGSGVVGKAQGFYVASSEEGTSQTVALTAMLTAGEYADSISLFGVHRTAESESYLAVVGGTGKYAGAKGFAKVAVVRTPAAAHETDGVESVLQFTVYLSAY